MALVTSVVVMAAAAVYSGVQQRKAAQAQKKSMRAQQKQADLAAARERRKAIRDSRVAGASVESQAATTGLVGATAAEGSKANITSATNENLSFMDRSAQLAAKASSANQAAASYASKAEMGQAVGKAAGQAYSIYTG